LGIGDWAQSPIPNPQSPIPNPHDIIFIIISMKTNILNYLKLIIKNIYDLFIEINGKNIK
jgi:hypothetical protein